MYSSINLYKVSDEHQKTMLDKVQNQFIKK